MVTSRIWFTPSQKVELWERWKQGQSISAISRALERRNKTGHTFTLGKTWLVPTYGFKLIKLRRKSVPWCE